MHIDSYKPFEECTGVTIEYEGSKEFEAQLQVRVEGRQRPGHRLRPAARPAGHPGREGAVKDRRRPRPSANVDKNWNTDWKDYGTVDGKFYAAPLGANMK